MKPFTGLLLVCLLGLALAKPKWHQLEGYTFEQYQKDFNRFYAEEEVEMRRETFERNLAKVQAHNKDFTKTWKEGVNRFTDRTQHEFKAMAGWKKSLGHAQVQAREAARKPIDPATQYSFPASGVDWRQKGVVSAVKDQGQCGSCWTFATAEAVESAWALKTGQLPVLSEQQILDCTPDPNDCGGTGGCNGGTVELALSQIKVTGGLSQEWTYPYHSYWGSNFQCSYSSNMTPPFAQVAGYLDNPSNHYEPTMASLAASGPLAITVEAAQWGPYESGVFDGCNQTNPDLDHGVNLVGYGTDPVLGDYYIVRNSWSPDWGEDGFIRIRRTASESTRCGLDLNPSDGDGCNNGPPTVTVCGTCGILYDTVLPLVKH